MLAVALSGLATLGCIFCSVELWYLYRLTKRPVHPLSEWPAVSIIKPLAGFDDDLIENIKSHLKLDYPAPYEVLLGVRSADDAAYPVAQQLAAEYPDRVSVHLQEGAPGFNPKVNQLITLTRHAKYDVIALTDSNVRVPPHWLRELTSMLYEPGIGLSTNLFSGVGEERIGAAFDNMTLSTFCGTNLATGELAFNLVQIVGKSLAIKKSTLAAIGGWEDVKDLLAEDQRLGRKLKKKGFRTRACPSFVENVQRTQPLSHFVDRHARWAMLRFRVLVGVIFEPLLNPMPIALVGALLRPSAPGGWAVFAACAAFSIAFTEASARVMRGHGFAPKWLALVPLRDLLFLFAYLRGATMRSVNWRGNKLKVGKKTKLSPG